MSDVTYFQNFDGYYLGWAILILVLLWILIYSGYYYAGDHGYGGSYHHDMSMSPGRGRGYHHY